MTLPREMQSAQAMAHANGNKDISASELLAWHFDRIDSINPEINAVIWQDRARASAEAATCDEETGRGESRGPLHGVPVTVKESFDLAGAPSTWGFPDWRDNIPKTDSDAVARLRQAGAIVFGKTNVPMALTEWQSFNDIYGTTNNPWDVTRTPGGSSGGSAAALATAMSALEVGSDIGSSIRNPAHYCGVFGLKPTWNVVSSNGQSPPGWLGDFDIGVAGPLARSAEDLTLAFNILAGAHRFDASAWEPACPEDSRTRLSEFRVAVKLNDAASPVDDAYQAQLAAFVEKLAACGVTLVDGRAPAVDSETHFTLYLQMLGAAMSVGAAQEEIDLLKTELAALDDSRVARVFGNRIRGMEMAHRDWLNADNERRQARLRFDDFFADIDLLIAPVCATAAFKHDQKGKRFTRKLTVNGREQPEVLQLFWSGYSGVVGLPSVVGPAGFVDGLPVGYQAITGHGCDHTALAFARAVEREIGGFVPPPAFAG